MQLLRSLGGLVPCAVSCIGILHRPRTCPSFSACIMVTLPVESAAGCCFRQLPPPLPPLAYLLFSDRHQGSPANQECQRSLHLTTLHQTAPYCFELSGGVFSCSILSSGLFCKHSAFFTLLLPPLFLAPFLSLTGIKVALPTETASGRCFLQLYIEYILALQQRSGTRRKLPLAIMTSADTHQRTVELLENHDYFGMDRDQVRGWVDRWDGEGNWMEVEGR